MSWDNGYRGLFGIVLGGMLGLVAPVRGQDCVTWEQQVNEGPQARDKHAMAYDAARGVVVLVGGKEAGPDGYIFGDTWEYDGSSWSLRATTGPGPHYSHAMAYDAAREVTVLFGGSEVYGVPTNETWVWDGNTWTNVTPPGDNPTPRESAAMAYDADRGVVVLFGGAGDWGARFGDTWEWDGSAWTLRSTTGPSARSAAAMAYDSARHVAVLHGGYDGAYNSETWEWDGTSWTQRASDTPSARGFATMVYDDARGVCVLFGGTLYPTPYGETWEWDGDTWTLQSDSGPAPRWIHGMAYDAARRVTVLFGGWDGAADLDDTWELGSTRARGDIDGDCDIDMEDFAIMQRHFTGPQDH